MLGKDPMLTLSLKSRRLKNPCQGQSGTQESLTGLCDSLKDSLKNPSKGSRRPYAGTYLIIRAK